MEIAWKVFIIAIIFSVIAGSFTGWLAAKKDIKKREEENNERI